MDRLCRFSDIIPKFSSSGAESNLRVQVGRGEASYIPDLWDRMSLCSRRPLTQLPSSHQGTRFSHSALCGSPLHQPKVILKISPFNTYSDTFTHKAYLETFFFLVSLNPEITLELVTIIGGLGDDWEEGPYYQQAVHNPARNFCSTSRIKDSFLLCRRLVADKCPWQEAT